jgi:hypothetical protein
MTQSAGNFLGLDLSGILRDYTPELICCNFIVQKTNGIVAAPEVGES